MENASSGYRTPPLPRVGPKSSSSVYGELGGSAGNVEELLEKSLPTISMNWCHIPDED